MRCRDGWRFALVDPGGLTDPTGAYARAADPDHDDGDSREVAVPTTGASSRPPRPSTAPPAAPASSPGGLGWYRLAFTLPPAWATQARLGGVRRRLHGRVRPLQRHPGGTSPVRVHRLRPRPHRSRAHRRHHPQRARGQGAEPAAEQPAGTPAAASTARPAW
ncbi:hypothetical protein LT493_15125 [Streptomyces tricolor]|nr:hypothetical protein [Streptomyces tricolor]